MFGFVKRTFPIFQCISSLNIIYARIHNSCTIEIRRPDFNGDLNEEMCGFKQGRETNSQSKDSNVLTHLIFQISKTINQCRIIRMFFYLFVSKTVEDCSLSTLCHYFNNLMTIIPAVCGDGIT